MGGARWCIVCVTEHWIAQNIPLNKQQVISEKKSCNNLVQAGGSILTKGSYYDGRVSSGNVKQRSSVCPSVCSYFF